MQPAYIFVLNLSKPVALIILIALLGCMVLQDVAQLTASSRFVWALARDQGPSRKPEVELTRAALPFSNVWRRVSTKHRIPRLGAALITVVAVPALLVLAAGNSVLTGLALQGSVARACWRADMAQRRLCDPAQLPDSSRSARGRRTRCA